MHTQKICSYKYNGHTVVIVYVVYRLIAITISLSDSGTESGIWIWISISIWIWIRVCDSSGQVCPVPVLQNAYKLTIAIHYYMLHMLWVGYWLSLSLSQITNYN